MCAEIKRILMFVRREELETVEEGVVVKGWKNTHFEKVGKIFSFSEIDLEAVKVSVFEFGRMRKPESRKGLLSRIYTPCYLEFEKVTA